MLSINISSSDEIVVTLTEKKTLSNGYYLFVFTNITTRAVVNKIYAFTADTSSYPARYNKFTLNTSSIFSGKNTGEWRYEVYEQASAVNTNPAGLTELERGLVKLNPATEFSFDVYNESTSFKTYGG